MAFKMKGMSHGKGTGSAYKKDDKFVANNPNARNPENNERVNPATITKEVKVPPKAKPTIEKKFVSPKPEVTLSKADQKRIERKRRKAAKKIRKAEKAESKGKDKKATRKREKAEKKLRQAANIEAGRKKNEDAPKKQMKKVVKKKVETVKKDIPANRDPKVSEQRAEMASKMPEHKSVVKTDPKTGKKSLPTYTEAWNANRNNVQQKYDTKKDFVTAAEKWWASQKKK